MRQGAEELFLETELTQITAGLLLIHFVAADNAVGHLRMSGLAPEAVDEEANFEVVVVAAVADEALKLHVVQLQLSVPRIVGQRGFHFCWGTATCSSARGKRHVWCSITSLPWCDTA